MRGLVAGVLLVELDRIGERIGMVAIGCERREGLLLGELRTEIDLAAEVGHDRVPGTLLVIGQVGVPAGHAVSRRTNAIESRTITSAS